MGANSHERRKGLKTLVFENCSFQITRASFKIKAKLPKNDIIKITHIYVKIQSKKRKNE